MFHSSLTFASSPFLFTIFFFISFPCLFPLGVLLYPRIVFFVQVLHTLMALSISHANSWQKVGITINNDYRQIAWRLSNSSESSPHPPYLPCSTCTSSCADAPYLPFAISFCEPRQDRVQVKSLLARIAVFCATRYGNNLKEN